MWKSLIFKKVLLEVAEALKIEHGKNHAVRYKVFFNILNVLLLAFYLTNILWEVLF